MSQKETSYMEERMNYYLPGTVKGSSMMEEMDKWVNSFFTNYSEKSDNSNFRKPVVDIQNLDKEYVVEAELPGLSEKEIDVKVEENLLTISSVRDEVKENEDKKWLIKERKNSSFKRSFYLPKDADVKKIKASYKDGVLTLNIEKREESKPFNIKIN